jgi:hypothetical protein
MEGEWGWWVDWRVPKRVKMANKNWIFTPWELGIVELLLFLSFFFLSLALYWSWIQGKEGLLGEVEVEVVVVVGRDNHNLGCIVLQVLFCFSYILGWVSLTLKRQQIGEIFNRE